MCMISGSTKPASKESGTGYKVFETEEGSDALYGICYGSDRARPRRRWLKAIDMRTLLDDRTQDVGWHIYARRKDAKALLSRVPRIGHLRVILKVKYRGAHTEGLGDGGWNMQAKVIVANEMLIL